MTTKTESMLADNYFGLAGKTALITGASSGIGKHFAEQLVAAGCNVVLAARRTDRLNALANELRTEYIRATILEMDVSNRESSKEALAWMHEQIGPIDILINNAGVARAARFLEASDEDTDTVIDTNQTGVWHVSQTVCKHMVEQERSGSIINIASILGLDVLPGVGSYAVSKAAVVQMTKVMALELARYNIRVNAIAPGYFDTEINEGFFETDAGQKILKRVPSRRIGNLDDLTGIMLLLASNKSAYMTGTVIPVDGGHLVAGLG